MILSHTQEPIACKVIDPETAGGDHLVTVSVGASAETVIVFTDEEARELSFELWRAASHCYRANGK